MNRRHFIRFGLAGIGGSLVIPQAVLAGSKSASLAGGLYFTKDAPGRWSKKVSGHLPHIAIQKNNAASIIEVSTAHEMKGYEHYIVKHILLDKHYNFLQEHMFNPNKDKTPISKFTLNNYSGTLYALSVCNKHDTWLNVAEI